MSDVIDIIYENQELIEVGDLNLTISTSGGQFYQTSITQNDLANGKISLQHNFNRIPVDVIVSNQLNQQVMPDDVIFINSNGILLDLTDYGTIIGTWNVTIY